MYAWTPIGEYYIDEDWKAVVEKYLNKRKLTREMVEAFQAEITA